MVPATGLEPVRFLRRGILSPLCLPIPPRRLILFLVAQKAVKDSLYVVTRTGIEPVLPP